MFPTDILIACFAAVLVVVIAPGPDNILAMSRGLSQGPVAAALSSIGAFAAQLSAWLARRPKAVLAANVGAGLTFVAAGLSILALERRR